jgi:glycosyltransferase involved in cell wall biosynthesis
MYNTAEYVSKAAKSITAQSFDGLEVILVDDGSTDNSLEVCLRHLPNADTVVIKQENTGLSGARNAGIHAAAGEYIMFLDADDFILPGAFKNILQKLDEHRKPTDVLFGRYLRWSPKGFLKGKAYNFQPPGSPKQRTEYIISALPEPAWNAWRYICRREFLTENNLFFEPGLLCEDIPWTLQLLDTAKTLDFLPEPFYAYYQHRNGSIMNSKNLKRLTDLNKIIAGHLPRYTKRPAIYRKLVWQSFFYINEYCTFKRRQRKLLYKSYQSVLPLYRGSPSLLHRIAGRLRCPFVFYLMSAGMLTVKYVRRAFKYLR